MLDYLKKKENGNNWGKWIVQTIYYLLNIRCLVQKNMTHLEDLDIKKDENDSSEGDS